MPDCCSVAECGRPRHRRKMCRTHYRRLLRTGEIGGVIAVQRKLEVPQLDHCGVEGCERKVLALNLCRGHYERHYLTGEPGDARLKVTSFAGHSLADRLERTGWTVTDSGCWEWSGGRDALGYGFIGIRSRRHLAHRVAHEAWIGPLTAGLVVMHLCDNPPCINPEHLREGTAAENTADMIAKGRAAHQRNRRVS